MKKHSLTIAVVSALCMAMYAEDTITVQQSRPLSALATELQTRYGYAVTYEEAPFDTSELQPKKLSNGRVFLSAPVVSLTFHMPELAVERLPPQRSTAFPSGCLMSSRR